MTSWSRLSKTRIQRDPGSSRLSSGGLRVLRVASLQRLQCPSGVASRGLQGLPEIIWRVLPGLVYRGFSVLNSGSSKASLGGT